MRRIASVILCAALVMMPLAGCGQSEGMPAVQTGEGSEDTGSQDLSDDPAAQESSAKEQGRKVSALSISKEVASMYRRQVPQIAVDACAYSRGETKTAILSAKELPSVCEVCRDDTDEVVYTGSVRLLRGAGEGEDRQTAVVDFTEVTAPGKYYLRAPLLGESYSFAVEEDAVDTLLKQTLRRYYTNRCGIALTQEYAGEDAHGVCHSADAVLASDRSITVDVTGGWHMNERADRFTETCAQIVANLLIAYELNPDAFGDDSGIPESGDEIPDILNEMLVGVKWLMKMQDQHSGGIYSAALTEAAPGANLANARVNVQPPTMEATVATATALAKFGNVFRTCDSELATNCLRAADRAYQWVVLADTEDGPADGVFTAAAELYRATGGEEYRRMLEQFFETEDFYDRVMDEPALFQGSVTYLMTGQEIDKEVADQLMKSLVKKAEETARAAKMTLCGAVIEGENAAEEAEHLLQSMQLLAVCDRVSYSYEYTTLLSEHLHVLCGRNEKACDYLNGSEGDSVTEGDPGILNRPLDNARLAAALAMLLAEGY